MVCALLTKIENMSKIKSSTYIRQIHCTTERFKQNLGCIYCDMTQKYSAMETSLFYDDTFSFNSCLGSSIQQNTSQRSAVAIYQYINWELHIEKYISNWFFVVDSYTYRIWSVHFLKCIYFSRPFQRTLPFYDSGNSDEHTTM